MHTTNEFSLANSIGEPYFLPSPGYNGVYVYKTASGFFAWEATCPNHAVQSCSFLEKTGKTLNTLVEIITAINPFPDLSLLRLNLQHIHVTTLMVEQ